MPNTPKMTCPNGDGKGVCKLCNKDCFYAQPVNRPENGLPTFYFKCLQTDKIVTMDNIG